MLTLNTVFKATVLLLLPASLLASSIGDDGLHKQDWFSLTFKDVAEDIQEARDAGKRLILVYEQKGCVYCEKMHEQLLTDPQISEYIKANYNVVQLNLFGSEEVTDLDGEVLTEKSAAMKWGVMFTPTIIFLPEDVPLGAGNVSDVAVAAMPGSMGKKTFFHMFQWVQEKGYLSGENFQKYHAARLAAGE